MRAQKHQWIVACWLATSMPNRMIEDIIWSVVTSHQSESLALSTQTGLDGWRWNWNNNIVSPIGMMNDFLQTKGTKLMCTIVHSFHGRHRHRDWKNKVWMQSMILILSLPPVDSDGFQKWTNCSEWMTQWLTEFSGDYMLDTGYYQMVTKRLIWNRIAQQVAKWTFEHNIT